MQGVEISHANASIAALCNAADAFLESPVSEVLRPISAYGKNDTLGMDAMPEITIINTLRAYDEHSVVITEEVGSMENVHFTNTEDSGRFRTVFICDPTDRSAQIKKALEIITDKTQTVASAMNNPEFIRSWEEKFGGPIAITGGSSAITCVRRGIPIFSVIINYITKQLFLACSAGCFSIELTDNPYDMNVDYILKNGKNIFFNNIEMKQKHDMQKFVTFLGKSVYRENFLDSNFMAEEDMTQNLYYDLPGGPTRALYLSTLQPENCPMGFILANGEKITEWIHWIPYLMFARRKNDQGKPALKLFEVSQDRPWTKGGILMSTPPPYSIFKEIDNFGNMIINVGKFGNFINPSHIRSTIMLIPAENQWANRIANQYGYRPIIIQPE